MCVGASAQRDFKKHPWQLSQYRGNASRFANAARECNPDEPLELKCARPDCSMCLPASPSSCVGSVSAYLTRDEGKEKPSFGIYRSCRWYLSSAAGICPEESVLSPPLQPGTIDLLLPRDVNSIANRRVRERENMSFQWPFWESLHNLAVIAAAYGRILVGAQNQLGTEEACLLSANRGVISGAAELNAVI